MTRQALLCLYQKLVSIMLLEQMYQKQSQLALIGA